MEAEKEGSKQNETWRQIIMSLRLRGVADDALALIERWLNADHVRSTWGDSDANVRLLRKPPDNGNWRTIIVAVRVEDA